MCSSKHLTVIIIYLVTDINEVDKEFLNKDFFFSKHVKNVLFEQVMTSVHVSFPAQAVFVIFLTLNWSKS